MTLGEWQSWQPGAREGPGFHVEPRPGEERGPLLGHQPRGLQPRPPEGPGHRDGLIGRRREARWDLLALGGGAAGGPGEGLSENQLRAHWNA